MTLDAIGILFSVSVFILFNRWGWGILHNEGYIVSLMLLAFGYLAASSIRSRLTHAIRITLAILIACLMVIVSTGSIMQERSRSLAHGFVNDSALQIEIAGRFILLGINPYSHSYKDTDLAKWDYRDDAGNTTNPALFTNVHPPLLLVISALQYKLFARIFGWSDIRVVYLLAYVSLILLAFLKFDFTQRFLQFLVFGLMNPIFVTFLAQGTNDVVVLALILWMFFAAEHKKFILAGGLMGLAIATKQTAWIAAPFFLYWIWKTRPFKQFLYFVVAAVSVSLLLYVPFALRDTTALLNSLVFYVSSAHPIEGFGVSALLPKWGVVQSIYTKYPFWAMQLMALFAVWILFVRTTNKRRNQQDPILFYVALATGLTWIFSAYFLPSHVGYIMTAFGCAYVWHHLPQSTD